MADDSPLIRDIKAMFAFQVEQYEAENDARVLRSHESEFEDGGDCA